jgi:hypothetical protein
MKQARTAVHIRDLVALGVVALFAHGLLLLNDGIYWDDWVIYPHLTGGDWSSINALVRESGMTHVNAAFLELFAYLPGGIFSVRLAVFALIVLIGLFTYLVALEAGLGRLEAQLIAALAVVFPGFQDWVLLVTASSVFDYALFLGSTLLLMRAECAGTRSRPWLRFAAIAGFLFSFSLSSLLALYLGVLVLLLLVSLRTTSLGAVVRTRWLYGIVLIALPVAYWVVSRMLYPVNGLYLGANSFATSPGPVATAIEHFYVNGIADHVRQALAALLRPWTWPLLVALVGGLALAWRRAAWPAGLSGRLAAGGLVIGVVALWLAMLPYALVGKYPSPHGWETRHDLLVAIPLAVTVVLVVRALLQSGRMALIGVGLVSLLAVGFAAAGVQDYAALQARWAVDRAVMARLQSMNGSGNFSVYWVRDAIPGPEPFYRFYEWSAMFREAYGGESRVGLDTRAYDSTFLARSQFFIERYDLAAFDPRGCQADLVITPGRSAATTGQVALMYSYYRLFQPEELPGFLDGLVTVSVSPLVSPLATDCRR